MSPKRKLYYVALLLFMVCLYPVLAQTPARPVADTWRTSQSLTNLRAAPVALIPAPQQATWHSNGFVLKKGVPVIVQPGDTLLTRTAVQSLRQILAEQAIDTQINSHNKPAIRFVSDQKATLKKEGYTLLVNSTGITVTAGDAAGFFYGVQTLRQLLRSQGTSVSVPGCRITDWPAFGLRGFMHDTGRNFQSMAMLKEHLEQMARYKYNTFHWHLTDNPAWRVVSPAYPQLSDPKNRQAGRDPDSSYTFDDVRALIRFARERHITIIPELDMPGHSNYFAPTFGFRMETPQGMKVLENLIDEFCREIPATDCPILHIGSDEVHIPNPPEFIRRMTEKVRANQRDVMVWNPGLPPLPGTIQQIWYDGQVNKTTRDSTQPYVDSYGGYLNIGDNLTSIRRYFFQQICNVPAGTDKARGGILCCWPDIRVDDKRKIYVQSPVWPALLTYGEALWCGRAQFDYALTQALPPKESQAGQYFAEFENRLARHRDQYFTEKPFPYYKFGRIDWQMSAVYKPDETPPLADFVAANVAAQKTVTGGEIRINQWLLPELKTDTSSKTVYFTSYLFSQTPRQIHAVIGFESPDRSNRRWAGMPANESWDANGGAVYINGHELPGPAWQNPGSNRYLQPTWHKSANEIPYADEELFWTRPPATIRLQAGWNQVVVRAPRTYKDQNWTVTFVPVRRSDGSGRWVEDESVNMVAYPAEKR